MRPIEPEETPATGVRTYSPAARNTAPHTAEKILDAAVLLFADRGFRATTVRQVAEQAGVSLGLVHHHFGSKAALRKACDAHVVDRIMTFKQENTAQAFSFGIDYAGLLAGDMGHLIDYLERLLLEPSEQTFDLFRHFTAAAETALHTDIDGIRLRPGADTHARAALVTGLGLSTLVFARHYADALAPDSPFDRAALLQRIAPELLDIFTHGLIVPDSTPPTAGTANGAGTTTTPTPDPEEDS
ncbi:TetR/AcrR family transcriptional regulator [Brevibacterium litoralis]|uniref:TetR/AcrR family transcriptional regulator n=1 Tax=Brevibacterium litoralis TaxID=3138935 RepID=UPI0032ED681F